MSFVKLPDEIFNQDITPAQFKIICALIKFSFEDNKSYLGHAKLAEFCRMDKASIKRNIKQLADAGFISVKARGAFSRSNEITLNFNRLTSQPLNGGSGAEGVFKSTPKGVFKSTPQGVFKSPQGVFKSTPHIDNRFKNQDLLIAENGEGVFKSTPEEKKATGDGAPVRSMPEMNRQGSQGGENELDLEHYTLAQAFFDEFSNDLFKFQLVSIDQYLCLRPYKAFRDIFDNAFDKAAAWFEERGVVLQRLKWSQHYQNEIIITKKQ